ncbi:MAG TPA: hypothetical protein VGF55_00535, partial [Gemmataceae bacterium]
MTRVHVSLFVAAAAGLAAASVSAQPRVQPDLAANAAMKYWQAFAQLPPRDDHKQERVRDWRTTPLDAAARELATESDKCFLYLRRGAALSRCDWSLDYEDGVGLLLPHLDKARTLTLLACLRARIALADGRPADGVDNLLAALTLGRHVADPIMICLLVDLNIELNAGDAIGLLLPKLDVTTVKRVADRLDALPAAATVEQTLVTEREHFVGWGIRRLKDLEQAGGGDMRAKVRALIGSDDANEIMTLVDDASAKRLIEALEGLRPFLDEQRRLVALPRDQFLAQWPALQAKQSVNHAAKVMLPAVAKVVNARDRARAHFALLRAAVDVVRDGQGALAKHSDPFGKGPFQYAARPHGFELRSALQIEGKPVVLVVGPP